MKIISKLLISLGILAIIIVALWLWNSSRTLHVAAAQGDCARVRYLLERGGDVNACDENGRTPLHVAVYSLRWSEKEAICVVEVLIEFGADVNFAADVNIMARYGETALGLAACYNMAEVARLLIDNGADVDKVTRMKSGWRPLHHAVYNESLETAELLIQNGCDVNATTDPAEMTPLHIAVASTTMAFDLTKLLLENGADPDIREHSGLTALDYASHAAYRTHIAHDAGDAYVVRDVDDADNVVRLLEEYGAEW